MAKRARGSTSRPGQRRPIQRPVARPGTQGLRQGSTAVPRSEVAATRPASLTAEEEARAAELEAVIVAQERQAEANLRRSQRGAPDVPARAGTSLATAAANEYAYVARDVRRVVIVGGSLVILLVALWIVVQVTGVSV